MIRISKKIKYLDCSWGNRVLETNLCYLNRSLVYFEFFSSMLEVPKSSCQFETQLHFLFSAYRIWVFLLLTTLIRLSLLSNIMFIIYLHFYSSYLLSNVLKYKAFFFKKYCLSYSCRTMFNIKTLTDGHSACLGVHALWCLRSFPSCPSTVLFPMGVWHLLCNQHRCCLFSLWLRQLK